MSRHRNRHRGVPSSLPALPAQLGGMGGNEPDLYGIMADVMLRAQKTYLNQDVALLRPQVGHSEMAHLWRLAVTARSATELRAESLRQVDFKLAWADGTLLEKEGGMSVQAKAVQNAFQNNFQSIIERCEASYCFYGEILLRRLYNAANRLTGFQWINNNFYQRETDSMVGLRGFRIRPVWGSELDNDLDWLEPEDSVYMHNIDFFEDFGGTGAVMVAYAQAATETEISDTQLMFFRNMAMPSFVIQPAQGTGYVPGIDDKDKLAEYLRRMVQGAQNSGRTAVLPTRWELLKFQADFDKLGMPTLSDQARDACLRILKVPLELLEPRQATRSSTGAKFYDTKREWLNAWLIPQSERYGDIFTEQVAKPLNPEWRVVPTYERVRGLEEDIDSRTKTVKDQISMIALDIYQAQTILGVDTDEFLEKEAKKGVRYYLVNGTPTPSWAFEHLHQYQPGNPGAISGGELAAMDKPEQPPTTETPKAQPAPSTPNSSAQPDNSKSIPFLNDAAYREWRNWQLVVARKGATYAFEAKSLPAHAVAFGRLLLSSSTEPGDDIWNAIRGQATKSYDDTENIYRTALYNLMQDAFTGNLDRTKFGQAGRMEIDQAFTSAFSNGLEENGVDPAEMDDDEKEAIKLEIKSERAYWTALADDMFENVIPLKGQDGYPQARDAMLSRIELWVSRGLYRAHQLGQTYGNMNGMVRFVLDGTKDHCRTCTAANGQVHRNKTWLRAGIFPRSEKCICKGIKCLCRFEPTKDRASGSISSIPVRDIATKSDDEHDHDHAVKAEETEAVAI